MDEEIQVSLMRELNQLMSLPPTDMTNRNYDDFPTVIRFTFLICLTSAAILRLAKKFIPLPSPKTVHNHYKKHMKGTSTGLSELENFDNQISTFIGMNTLQERAPASVAVDGMVMSADRSYLPSKDTDYSFVIYDQPLDRAYRCLPLHVITTKSGQATQDVRKVMGEVCTRLSNWGLVVKYICTDGGPGYNKYHRRFFSEWSAWAINGCYRVCFTAAETPCPRFSPLWKVFCNRVKNHSVTLSPDDGTDLAIGADSLETLLKLGTALQDRSSIGKMRHSSALQLFSLEKCVKCLQEDRTN
jgi:hypothetical protein